MERVAESRDVRLQLVGTSVELYRVSHTENIDRSMIIPRRKKSRKNISNVVLKTLIIQRQYTKIILQACTPWRVDLHLCHLPFRLQAVPELLYRSVLDRDCGNGPISGDRQPAPVTSSDGRAGRAEITARRLWRRCAVLPRRWAPVLAPLGAGDCR